MFIFTECGLRILHVRVSTNHTTRSLRAKHELAGQRSGMEQGEQGAGRAAAAWATPRPRLLEPYRHDMRLGRPLP